MDEATMRSIMRASVETVCRNLTDEELVAVNMAAQLDQNPKGVLGYDKAQILFTEHDGTRMHYETKLALASIVNRRLG